MVPFESKFMCTRHKIQNGRSLSSLRPASHGLTITIIVRKNRYTREEASLQSSALDSGVTRTLLISAAILIYRVVNDDQFVYILSEFNFKDTDGSYPSRRVSSTRDRNRPQGNTKACVQGKYFHSASTWSLTLWRRGSTTRMHCKPSANQSDPHANLFSKATIELHQFHGNNNIRMVLIHEFSCILAAA